jgi:hypothetical protein
MTDRSHRTNMRCQARRNRIAFTNNNLFPTMRKTLLPILAAALTLAGTSSKAATYTDPAGDVFTGAGGGILDILSVEVSHNLTDLIFKINLAGNPVATDWGKYMIGFDTVPGGDTSANGNGWVRPISLTTGMDYWVGTWVDSGNGAELYNYSGTWSLNSATYGANPANLSISKDSSSVTVSFAFAALGLGYGSTFNFDVYTSGGGGSDSAVDSLANPLQSISDWSGPYSSALSVTYTIPEPSSFALGALGLASLLIIRRRKA